MKELGCAELGGDDGCQFRARGETAADVRNQIYAHAAKAYPEKLKGMTDEQKAQMDARMNELLA